MDVLKCVSQCVHDSVCMKLNRHSIEVVFGLYMV